VKIKTDFPNRDISVPFCFYKNSTNTIIEYHEGVTMKRAIPIIAILLLLAGFVTAEEDEGPGFEIHDPIVIIGNEDLTSENGITGGSGTESDPYLIEGWWINVSEGSGIIIEGTDAHILIRGTAVTHSLEDAINITDTGIIIRNCSNIRFERTYVYYFNLGLEVKGSYNIHLLSSSFIQNHDGVIMQADDSSVWGCICSYNTRFGLKIYNSTGFTVRDVLSDVNSFTMGEGSGVLLENCSDIVVAECYGTLNYGGHITVIGEGSDLLIEDCYSDSNVFGILVISMDHVVIKDSRIRGNTYGIRLDDVTDLLATGNYIYKNSYGVLGYGISNSMIDNNDFERNSHGMTLDSSFENEVKSNYFFESDEEAVIILSTEAIPQKSGPNIIWKNDFISNNDGDDQVRDHTGSVLWSKDGIGNFWSNWQGNDTNRDGIVDESLEISNDVRDAYPLKQGEDEITQDLIENDNKNPEYWVVVSLSTLATLMLGLIILYNRRSSNDG